MASDATKPKPPTDSFIARIDARIDERARRLTDEQLEATMAAAEKQQRAQLASRIDREIRAGVQGISELRVAASGTTIVLTGSAVNGAAMRAAGTMAANHAPFATIDNFIVVKR
jgi:hypothetical protein